MNIILTCTRTRRRVCIPAAMCWASAAEVALDDSQPKPPSITVEWVGGGSATVAASLNQFAMAQAEAQRGHTVLLQTSDSVEPGRAWRGVRG